MANALIGLLGASMGTARQDWMAATIHATMFLPVAASNVITPDCPLAMWTTAAFACFWMSARPGAGRVRMWQMLMCAAFGVGFPTRGPAALIPSAPMFLFLLIRGRATAYFLTPWAVPGVLLFGLLGAGWYVAIGGLLPGAKEFFWENQVLARTVSPQYGRNEGLGFYDGSRVERFKANEDPYPFFARHRHIEEKFAEPLTGYDHHVFVTQKEKYAGKVRALPNERGMTYTEYALSFERRMFICPAAERPPGSGA